MKKDNPVPHVDKWVCIPLEIYCMLNIDYFEKESEYYYAFDPDKPIEEWVKEPNPDYDPNARPARYPKDCKKKVGINCLSCKYVGYCEGEEE